MISRSCSRLKSIAAADPWQADPTAADPPIVTTGRDIRHLMDALSALNRMYTLIYTLVVIGLLVLLASAGLFPYAQWMR
jgi:hypothetical protein